MSVLVELLSVVIPRRVLEVTHPGGARAFLDMARDGSWGARWVCADDHLASVSFVSRADVTRLVRVLEELAIVHASPRAGAPDVVCVSEREGPETPCDWLAWERHPDGYTHCWLAGAPRGTLCSPEGWEPASGARREPPGGKLRLAEENGVEIWLDFSTGRLTAVAHGDARPPAGDARPRKDAESWEKREPAVLPVLRRALDERDWAYTLLDDGAAVVWTVAAANVTYRVVAMVDERYEQLACYVVYPAKVPSAMRAPAAEFLTRANHGLRLGNFEMDFDDGEVRFKVSVDVEGGVLGVAMVHTMLSAAIGTAERYHEALLRVVYGGASPAEAVREAEED